MLKTEFPRVNKVSLHIANFARVQEVNALRVTLAKGGNPKEEEMARCRQLESLRREDEAKLRDARRENDQLKAELDAMIGGAKRSDIGLVSVFTAGRHDVVVICSLPICWITQDVFYFVSFLFFFVFFFDTVADTGR
jgi:hypothetical protein